jgi:ATP-dependent Clp protease ATP-binding subunit ClpA
MMVEPSDNLQAVFERAIETAKKLHHEYLTIEHLLLSMLGDDGFNKCITGYGADAAILKDNVKNYVYNKSKEITIEDVVVKPKKTQSVERILNRAFTQVLFNGRQKIEPTDVFLAMIGEKRSWSHYYINKAKIESEKLGIPLSYMQNQNKK